MSELIPVGNDAQASADITLAAGETATLTIIGATPEQVPVNACVLVQQKEGADYFNIGQIFGSDPCRVLDAIGTYRVYRPGSITTFGVIRG